MEMAIRKRQNIRFRNEATKLRDTTESQLERACHDLRRNIRATKKEIEATDLRIQNLQEQREQLTIELSSCRQLKDQEKERHDDIQHKLNEARHPMHPINSLYAYLPLRLCHTNPSH